jgi:hypothetical protein
VKFVFEPSSKGAVYRPCTIPNRLANNDDVATAIATFAGPALVD